MLGAEGPTASIDFAVAAIHAEANDALLETRFFLVGPALIALLFHGAPDNPDRIAPFLVSLSLTGILKPF